MKMARVGDNYYNIEDDYITESLIQSSTSKFALYGFNDDKMLSRWWLDASQTVSTCIIQTTGDIVLYNFHGPICMYMPILN